jgi:Cu2+-exporting ATPase
LLTGESRPIEVSPGDPVHAGTVNLGSRVLVEVRSTGENTRVGRLLQLVEEMALRRAPVVLLTDRISGWFVAAVLGLAASTLLIWLQLAPARAVDNAVALLIVSCPCALGLATPLAVAAAIGRAARAGILIKGGDALEQLARPARMVLDKTGTITEGRVALVHWRGVEWLRAAVGTMEVQSSHPVAVALADSTDAEPRCRVEDLRSHARGLTARCDGRDVLVGSPGFALDSGIDMPDEWKREIDEVVGRGLTPVVAAVDGAVAGLAGLGDPIRENASTVLERIRSDGWSVEILSGDHQGTVDAVAHAVGLSRSRGSASPEQKAEYIAEATKEGRVAMVGDGVNDAAALAAATVGIGVHGGAEATLAVADVFLGRPGLHPLVELLDGSRRTMRVIRRNVAFSLAYNVVAISLAVAGLMHPLVAAILMPLSSITVVVSSYRAKTFLISGP